MVNSKEYYTVCKNNFSFEQRTENARYFPDFSREAVRTVDYMKIVLGGTLNPLQNRRYSYTESGLCETVIDERDLERTHNLKGLNEKSFAEKQSKNHELCKLLSLFFFRQSDK